jgi:hypothetical protein
MCHLCRYRYPVGALMQVSSQSVDFDIKTRYLKIITDEPSTTEHTKVERKFKFLTEIVDSMYSGVLNCGPMAFDKLAMEHNGTAWVIKLEAEVFK